MRFLTELEEKHFVTLTIGTIVYEDHVIALKIKP